MNFFKKNPKSKNRAEHYCTGGDYSYGLGGLCGGNGDYWPYRGGAITNCYVTGSVTSGDRSWGVGGLCGYNYIGTITNCYAACSVTSGDSHSIGGLCGENWVDGTITNCYSGGSVTGGSGSAQLGGLCGVNIFESTISNCYATGSVSGGAGSEEIGGLCGLNTGHPHEGNGGIITNCYATGSVTSGVGSKWLGGLCGDSYNGGRISDCFWDVETSGIDLAYNYGAIGKTTLQMQTETTFTDAGWDFGPDDGDAADWYMPSNYYPRLYWQANIDYDGQPEISLALDEYGTVQIDVYGPDNEALNWTITGYESYEWITSLNPNSGSSTGPADKTTVTIDIDSIDLSVGDYICGLTLAADNGASLPVPISLHVYNRTDLEEFALLSQYWQSTGCDRTQDCSAADWYVDDTIDILDLRQLALSWMGEEIITSSSVDYLEDFSDGLPVEGWSYSSTSHGRIQVVGERLRMDGSYPPSFELNEAVLHADLSGESDIVLSFWQAKSGNNFTALPATFTGSVYGEGVAVSPDGVNWTTVVNAPFLNVGIVGQTFTVDLDAVGLEYTSDFQIKFQQSGSQSWDMHGREWDDIQIYKVK